MTAGAARFLGFVDFQDVWLDDRRRCRWALRGLDLTVTPRSLVAVVGDADDGGPDAVVDLLLGRRRPTKGTVSIDGCDLRDADPAMLDRSLVELELRPAGERRVCIGSTTVLAVRPSPATLAAADLVIVLSDGVEVGRGSLAPARAG